ncbi:MAG: hypothetical protein AAFQ60_08390, partial [Pseudomonadota bacterium]
QPYKLGYHAAARKNDVTPKINASTGTSIRATDVALHRPLKLCPSSRRDIVSCAGGFVTPEALKRLAGARDIATGRMTDENRWQ